MEKNKFIDLNQQEIQSIDGGWLLFVAGAFVAGVTYGYVKEKIDSGQW